MISRRAFLGGVAATAACQGTEPRRPQTADLDRDDVVRRPNILLIYPDQLRSHSLSLYGGPNIATPVMDRLLQSGTSFAHHMTANPLCTPARASLITGLHSHAIGMEWNHYPLAEGTRTIGTELQAAGYRTAWIGKWHLAGGNHFVPLDQRFGFEYFAGTDFQHKYLDSFYYTDTNEALYPQPRHTFEPEYQTDLALDFIDVDDERPWFVTLAYGPPHPPGRIPMDWSLGIPQEYLDRVDPEALQMRANVPGWFLGPNLAYGPDLGAQYQLQGYLAATLAMEDVIDRLLAGLDARGLTGDTLVVFTSDHGTQGGSQGLYRKNVAFEESIRVPLGFSWPGVIRPQEWSFPASTVDVVPTLLALAGAEALPTHGIDLSPWLLGSPAQPERDHVHVQGRLIMPDPMYIVRTSTHKLVNKPEEQRLYDLVSDPFEQRNLVDDPAYTGLLAELQDRAEEDAKQMDLPPLKTDGKWP